MKTQPASRTLDLSAVRSKPGFSEVMVTRDPAPAANVLSDSRTKSARRDALSFSICFAVIALLTGALLFYKMGVTISSITSLLFYASLAGMVFFAGRAIYLSRQLTSLSLAEEHN